LIRIERILRTERNVDEEMDYNRVKNEERGNGENGEKDESREKDVE
jgi:hypothetical protein